MVGLFPTCKDDIILWCERIYLFKLYNLKTDIVYSILKRFT